MYAFYYEPISYHVLFNYFFYILILHIQPIYFLYIEAPSLNGASRNRCDATVLPPGLHRRYYALCNVKQCKTLSHCHYGCFFLPELLRVYSCEFTSAAYHPNPPTPNPITYYLIHQRLPRKKGIGDII